MSHTALRHDKHARENGQGVGQRVVTVHSFTIPTNNAIGASEAK